MQHEILDRLHRDHINMARIIALISDALAAFEHGMSVDLDVLEDALVYITRYPDATHHPTEDVVFERLKAIAPDAAPAINELLEEHQELVASGQALLASIRAIEEEAFVTRSELVSAGQAYIDALEQHMHKEESSIFRLAAERLGEADWARIAAAVDTIEDPLFGPAVSADHRRLWQRITAHSAAPSA